MDAVLGLLLLLEYRCRPRAGRREAVACIWQFRRWALQVVDAPSRNRVTGANQCVAIVRGFWKDQTRGIIIIIGSKPARPQDLHAAFAVANLALQDGVGQLDGAKFWLQWFLD